MTDRSNSAGQLENADAQDSNLTSNDGSVLEPSREVDLADPATGKIFEKARMGTNNSMPGEPELLAQLVALSKILPAQADATAPQDGVDRTEQIIKDLGSDSDQVKNAASKDLKILLEKDPKSTVMRLVEALKNDLGSSKYQVRQGASEAIKMTLEKDPMDTVIKLAEAFKNGTKDLEVKTRLSTALKPYAPMAATVSEVLKWTSFSYPVRASDLKIISDFKKMSTIDSTGQIQGKMLTAWRTLVTECKLNEESGFPLNIADIDQRLKDIDNIKDLQEKILKLEQSFKGKMILKDDDIDAGLRELKDLDWRTRLTDLGLRTFTVTKTGLKELKEFTNLKNLYLGNSNIGDAEVMELKGLTGIETLDLGHTQVTDTGLGALKELRGLKMLFLKNTNVSGAGLKELKNLSKLETLDLDETKITDEGLSELKAFHNLTELYLFRTNVTDAGLKHLKELKEMKQLDLCNTHVTDAGLPELKELKGLKKLNLSGTQVTDAGTTELKGLKGLQALYLTKTQITDIGLKELKELKGLQMLYLDDTKITDVGLKELKELPELTELYLGGSQITDAGLRYLKGFGRLKHLEIISTDRVTDAGVAELKKARPDLVVIFK